MDDTSVVIYMNGNNLEKKKNYGWLVVCVFFLVVLIIICIGYRINYKMEFYGEIINAVGSQRATTFKILSDTESALIFYNKGDKSRYEAVKYRLFEDDEKIEHYFEIMYQLKEYSKDFSLSKKAGAELQREVDDVSEDMFEYIELVEIVMDNPQGSYENGNYDLLVESAYICYDEIDDTVLELQHQFDLFANIQKFLLVFSFCLLIACSIIIIYLLKKVKVIEYIAKYDYLTGVRNISYLGDETKHLAVDDYALIFIDLNKFKQINDTYGHSVGDEILREVGKRLKKELAGNLVFRYGGDEFVVFIKNENTGKIEEYINNINNNVFTTVVDSCKREHKVCGSVGVVGKDVTKATVEVGVKIADSIMYRAKDDDIVLYARTDEEVKEILDEIKIGCKSKNIYI